jgi:hypothetical protein
LVRGGHETCDLVEVEVDEVVRHAVASNG